MIRAVLSALVSSALSLVVVCAAIATPPDAGVTTPSGPPPRCNEQRPQDFLIRGNYISLARHTPQERRARQAVHQRAIRYRTEQYGYFQGFGSPAWNAHPPTFYAEQITFMGLRVRLHRKIIPAVRCVEQQLRTQCANEHYAPRRLSGIRTRNTYHTGEITNHVYGIAIDIDPDRNTCCHCVAKWRDHPLCKRQVQSIFERMSMPECWVNVFERYGFYWLGHDTLQDTMHFEFLGVPEAIRAP